jgi:hypothetical protein
MACWVNVAGTTDDGFLTQTYNSYALYDGLGYARVYEAPVFKYYFGYSKRTNRASTWKYEVTNPTGVWYHLAASFDAIDARRLYINGVHVGGDTASIDYAPAESTRVGAGRDIYGSTAYQADPIIGTGVLSDPMAQWLANRANNPWQPWRRKSWAVTGGTPPAVTTRNLILGGGVI